LSTIRSRTTPSSSFCCLLIPPSKSIDLFSSSSSRSSFYALSLKNSIGELAVLTVAIKLRSLIYLYLYCNHTSTTSNTGTSMHAPMMERLVASERMSHTTQRLSVTTSLYKQMSVPATIQRRNECAGDK
jgi:hypothetical protein